MNTDIIRRYLNGEASEDEIALIDKWIEAEGESWLDDHIDKMWDQPTIASRQETKDAMASLVLSRVGAVGRVKKMSSRKRLLPWVAAASVLLAVTLLWRQFAEPAHKSLSWEVYRNDQPGIVKLLRLPDSSVVYLNAASSLSIASNFNDSTREVALQGEAFFEVKHDADRPFKVKVGSLTTRVYGTAFNIEGYSASSQLRVALKNGKIGIRQAAMPEQLLKPGEMMLYHKADSTTEIHQVTESSIGDWATGQISFYKTPIRDAFTIIENKYGVKFKYPGSLQNQTITASFGKESLQKVLKHLSFVWDLRFQQEKDTVYVH
ncbi:DUF4974 domain-containing protein [Pseudoflavitalea sp. G-6-1-2]|uniref:FecR family protein n=1 Tax=Pseudoflavitalea sp. G-6-1-2 TaxID=2728841 RepID=UPI00146EEC6C|nr:FecR family protein [Pseudoflavitalea sp. G-6-1-2]NML23999.1 DUF4974 domain-containing protein [Pseudoflavitalea sp. G-6-1-2]